MGLYEQGHNNLNQHFLFVLQATVKRIMQSITGSSSAGQNVIIAMSGVAKVRLLFFKCYQMALLRTNFVFLPCNFEIGPKLIKEIFQSHALKHTC